MCNHLVVLQEYGLLLLSGNDCLQVGQFSSDMTEREREKSSCKRWGKTSFFIGPFFRNSGKKYMSKNGEGRHPYILGIKRYWKQQCLCFSRKSGSCASLSSELTRERLFIPPPSIAAATKRKATEFKAVPVQTQENSVFGTWLWGENVHVERTACYG